MVLNQMTNHQTDLIHFTEQTTAEIDSPNKLKTDARVFSEPVGRATLDHEVPEFEPRRCSHHQKA
jgi:hypothetical protein